MILEVRFVDNTLAFALLSCVFYNFIIVKLGFLLLMAKGAFPRVGMAIGIEVKGQTMSD